MENIQEKSATATVGFKFMTDAIKEMTCTQNWVERIALEFGEKLEFVPLGIEDGKICFRVACRKRASDISQEMIDEMEQKSNFELVKTSDRYFCNEYTALIYV